MKEKLNENLKEKLKEKFERIWKDEGMLCFGLRFAVVAAVLLVVFHFTFAYYRLALMYGVKTIMQVGGFDLQTFNQVEPNRIVLAIMPYVSLSALIIATPRKSIAEKIKFTLLMFILFYSIDIVFIFAQIFLQSETIAYYQIAVVQEFFTIALPIAIWFLFSYKDLGL